MLVTGVCVTRTTRDDAYDGNECGLDRGGLPLGSYFVYDLSLPSIIFPRSDNPSYALTQRKEGWGLASRISGAADPNRERERA